MTLTFGGRELLPERIPFAVNPPILEHGRISERAATDGSDWLRGSYDLRVSGTLHGEHVSIEVDRRELMEGIEQGWMVEELALIRRRLDRFTRREI